MTPDDVATRLRVPTPATERASRGERACFAIPGCAPPSGAVFATIKAADGPDDRAFALDREVGASAAAVGRRKRAREPAPC